jgi:hypothetical protein
MDATMQAALDAATLAPRLFCSSALGLALLLCVLYGGVCKDRRFLYAYCLLNPIFTLLLLFYVLPYDYQAFGAARVHFVDEFYGRDNAGTVFLILFSSFSVLFSTCSWLYAWVYSSPNFAKPHCIRDDNGCDEDDHPYHRPIIKGSRTSFL